MNIYEINRRHLGLRKYKMIINILKNFMNKIINTMKIKMVNISLTMTTLYSYKKRYYKNKTVNNQ